MTIQQRGTGQLRRLGPVPWFREGFEGLSLRARDNVPPADDAVIRSAMVRAVLNCGGVEGLDREVNDQLRPLGYAATLFWARGGRNAIVVEITQSH